MTAAVEVEGLVKEYGDRRVVDGVDLTIPEGTVLGLLGPNGAGKTTTVRMLSTLIRPDGGRARIGGYDLVKQATQVRRLIGLTGQYASVDEGISGRENLYLIARLLDFPRRRARERVDELLEQFDLVDAASRPAGKYSGGMRRRLDLAASMVGDPALLYLDEPTTGLDPRSRNNLWDAVRDLVEEGTTVLLTTQYMEEAEALADSIMVMDRGRVIASGTSAELRARVGGQVLRIRTARREHLDELVRRLSGMRVRNFRVDQENRLVSVPIVNEAELTGMVQVLAASRLPIAGLDTHLPSLDEVFLTLTDKPREADPDATVVLRRVF
ncbi:ATP-binding cassette domain-containing protein [Saccharopolyspora sp. NPDC000359]|uniref:ATP-binding cassette domain-containing protein n=1 Tax=Saccharopolyspora sp. NPDC000359 TaxID=3154251 RepID=UPI003318780E